MNDIQMWNNAAFDDNGNDLSFFPMKTSWSSSSDCAKENMSPPAPNYSSNVKTIDAEIHEIEREIKHLTTRLDALRLEKAKRAAKRVVGRVIPAKFMEPKPKPNGLVSRKLPHEETPKIKSNNSWRRGMSMGPAEIAATPATAQTHRRKSCFWKLPEIDEVSKAKTTVSRVKKKEEPSLVVQVQPRKLFERESNNNTNKKGFLKQGRVVASRYNSACGGDVRKRSLPEGGSEVRVKKRWEIPKNTGEVAATVAVAVALLPKIKTVKCVNESPRDSGAAKRVAELVGKRGYFSTDEKDVCQILNFAEEEE